MTEMCPFACLSTHSPIFFNKLEGTVEHSYSKSFTSLQQDFTFNTSADE